VTTTPPPPFTNRPPAALPPEGSGGLVLSRTVRVNGDERTLRGAPDAALDALLRRDLGLKSVLHGCEGGACGACRVIVDGYLIASCNYPLERVRDGASIDTAEGLQGDPRVRTVLRAFVSERDTRCALCLGGLAAAAAHLERTGREHDEHAIDVTVAGASCACTGRGSLKRALLEP
jgi:nicotinate dehydrogenase subunit A